MLDVSVFTIGRKVKVATFKGTRAKPYMKYILFFSVVAFQHAAYSQPLVQCVRELVSAGVSPNVAADKCVTGGASDPAGVDVRIDKYEKCLERNQYSILRGSAKARGDGKTEYEYSIPVEYDYSNNRAMKIPDWVGRAGATCWVHGIFFPKILCWDSEIKREVRSPREAAKACRALAPARQVPGPVQPSTGGSIIINQ